jgi:hypothetical protein
LNTEAHQYVISKILRVGKAISRIIFRYMEGNLFLVCAVERLLSVCALTEEAAIFVPYVRRKDE